LQGRDFAMLAVSEDTNADDVASFVKELDLTFPILLDTSNRLPPRLGVTGYPETFVIDRDGRVIKHVIGPEEWMDPRVIAYFEQLIGGKGVTGDQ
jgi:peroxiredoxin